MSGKIICCTCGTMHPNYDRSNVCSICNDDRQYVPEDGQKWTTTQQLKRKHSIKLNKIKESLYEFEVNPSFAIGQRALFVISPNGNVLWDCIPLLDEMTVEFINSKGGLKAIAFSHPHFYSNMNEWAEVFNCPIYIHKNDAEFIVDKGPKIQLWDGDEIKLWDGIRIILIGGHFPGSSILHVPFLSESGTIICGDTLFLSPSKKHFSMHWSSPNRIPLPVSEMKRLKKRFDVIPFDTFYGYIKSQNLDVDVKKIFEISMQRYFS